MGARPATTVLMGLMALLFAACPAGAASHVTAVVSILPQAYMVEKIGGERVRVEVMVLPGANPATYEPTPRQMAALASANVYFATGVPFERAWLPRMAAMNPAMTIVHIDRGIEKQSIAIHRHDTPAGRHHASGDDIHEAGIPDPHIWLSPPLVRLQAEHIVQALVSIDPAGSNEYERRMTQFRAELDQLHGYLEQLFKDVQGRPFLVFHPSWGYFANTYGLRQIPIEIDGKSPKPSLLTEVIRFAREHDIGAVFVQPQFSMRSARLVADAVGARIVVADPLAKDWHRNLLKVARQLHQAVGGQR